MLVEQPNNPPLKTSARQKMSLDFINSFDHLFQSPLPKNLVIFAISLESRFPTVASQFNRRSGEVRSGVFDWLDGSDLGLVRVKYPTANSNW